MRNGDQEFWEEVQRETESGAIVFVVDFDQLNKPLPAPPSPDRRPPLPQAPAEASSAPDGPQGGQEGQSPMTAACPACGRPAAPLPQPPLSLQAQREGLEFAAADGSLRRISLTIPEMAWLTACAGVRGGRGYSATHLFNKERGVRGPAGPALQAAYAAVVRAALKAGWLDESLDSRPTGRRGGEWRVG